MAGVRPVEKIQAAATIFVFVSRDIEKIADALEVSRWAVEKWSKTAEWHAQLDAHGYTGDRNFKKQPSRDAKRDAGGLFDQAEKVYKEMQRKSVPKHKLASGTAEQVGLTPRRVRTWAKRYDW